MGAGASIRGLYYVEMVWPEPNGRSVFNDPKLGQKLQKEKEKGWVPPTLPKGDVDQDHDSIIDASIREIWQVYDPKNLGFMDKKMSSKFLGDILEVFALRQGKKSAEILAPGVKKGDAVKEAQATMEKGTGQVSYKAFEEFVNQASIEEALAFFTGKRGPMDVDSRLANDKMFDQSSVKREQRQAKAGAIKYRDYGQD